MLRIHAAGYARAVVLQAVGIVREVARQLGIARADGELQLIGHAVGNFAETGDLAIVGLIVVVIDVALGKSLRRAVGRVGRTREERTIYVGRILAEEILIQIVDIRVGQLLDTELRGERPECTHGPSPPTVVIVRLQANFVRPDALAVRHPVGGHVACDAAGRQMNALAVDNRIPRAGRRFAPGAAQPESARPVGIRGPYQRLKVCEVEYGTLIGRELVAVVVRGIPDERADADVRLELDRAEIVLVRIRYPLRSAVDEPPAAHIRIRGPE